MTGGYGASGRREAPATGPNRRAAAAVADDLGLEPGLRFFADGRFLLAMAAGPVALLGLGWLVPTWSVGIRPTPAVVLALVVWHPLIEELLFRGLIQGKLERTGWGRREAAGFSCANLIASLLFVLAHWVHHPPVWAAAVLLPSLLFGYFRDRHRQVYPSLVLHAWYNGCYLLLGAALASRPLPGAPGS